MAFSFRRTKKHDDVIVDRVTGAFNRRQLDADVAAGLETSDQPTATLLIEVDGFALYNGKKGVASGDQVLERVSWVIMATVRTTDVVYRHAVSSFCVLLPATSDDDAVAVADRIRGNVQKMPLLAESRVTVSVGVATGTGTEVATTIERADQALAAGAGSGANQVFAGGMSTSSAVPAAADMAVPAAPASGVPAADPSMMPAPLATPAPMAPQTLVSVSAPMAPPAPPAPGMATPSLPGTPLSPPSL